jgi:hypothetical protein
MRDALLPCPQVLRRIRAGSKLGERREGTVTHGKVASVGPGSGCWPVLSRLLAAVIEGNSGSASRARRVAGTGSCGKQRRALLG